MTEDSMNLISLTETEVRSENSDTEARAGIQKAMKREEERYRSLMKSAKDQRRLKKEAGSATGKPIL